MPIQAGLLNQFQPADVRGVLTELNPAKAQAAAQAVLLQKQQLAAQQQYQQAQIQQQQAALAENQRQSLSDEQLRAQQFQYGKTQDIIHNQLAQQQLELQQTTGLGQLDIAKQRLGLDAVAQPTDIAYKQSLIDNVKYGMDPANPENQLRKAQTLSSLVGAQKDLSAIAAGPTPDSPEGKYAMDLQRFPQLAANMKANSTTNKDLLTQENTLRDDWTKQSDDYFRMNNAYNRIKSVGVKPGITGSIALVYGLMQMMAPSIKLQEGQIATVENAQGIDQRTMSLYNDAINGKELNPTLKADLLKTSAALYGSIKKTQDVRNQQFTEVASRQGLDPRNIIMDPTIHDDDPSTTATGATIPTYSDSDFSDRDARLGLPPGTSKNQYDAKVSTLKAGN